MVHIHQPSPTRSLLHGVRTLFIVIVVSVVAMASLNHLAMRLSRAYPSANTLDRLRHAPPDPRWGNMTLECLPQVITTRICNRYSKLNRYHEVLVKNRGKQNLYYGGFGPKGRWVHTLREVLEDGQWMALLHTRSLACDVGFKFYCLRPGESVWFSTGFEKQNFRERLLVRFWRRSTCRRASW